jgi:hypothetical protein
LQINTETSRIYLAGSNYCSAEKFVLFNQQNLQSGFLVHIGTLAGSFLHIDNNYVLANSRTPHTFMIIPVVGLHSAMN